MATLRLLCVFFLSAQIAMADPSWWTQSSAQLVQQGEPPADYGAATVGQLKWAAYCAKLHLDDSLAGGAGTDINNLIAGFKPQQGVSYTKEEREAIARDNYSALTIGQLKAVAKIFYDRLTAGGYDTRANLIAYGYPASWPSTNIYPWDPNTAVASNYAVATVGQLKLVFSFDVIQGYRVAPAMFGPPTGTFYPSVQVTLSSATPGAAIRYTVDGTAPTSSSPIYTGPLNINSTTTVTAAAMANGIADSLVTSATYTIPTNPAAVATPTFSPRGGLFYGPTSVSISTITSGATIRYTLDGSVPTANSSIYTGPILISYSSFLKAVAFLNGFANSSVASSSFNIQPQPVSLVSAPTISPPGGSFVPKVTVSLQTSTSGAEIRYTLTGRDPSKSSTLYTGPFAISSTATLKVKAFKVGMTSSAITRADFSISKTGATSANLNPFDFAILTYSWTSTSGKDLDTRTSFFNVNLISGAQVIPSAINNQVVGWSHPDPIGPVNAPFLKWQDDNKESFGQEIVAVDFKSLNYALQPTNPKVRLRAFWYETHLSGSVTVNLKTYNGGAISSFSVVGGTLTNNISLTTNVEANVSGDVPGEDVGVISYDSGTKQGTFTVYSVGPN